VPNILNSLTAMRTVARVPHDGEVLKLNRRELNAVRLGTSETRGFVVEFSHRKGFVTRNWRDIALPDISLQGDEAVRAARHLLPNINRAGGRSSDVADAVAVLGRSRDRDNLFAQAARAASLSSGVPSGPWWKYRDTNRARSNMIANMPASVRLALEMSLHEEDERRALEGELAELEDRWREAEEVAAISDDMFMPSRVGAMLKRLKGDGST
ncbi:MAG: hypothetical protein ACREN6_06705, partial [Gemmatimonadaceae bacterium]